MLPNQFARSLCFSILNLSHCTDKNWNYKDVVSPFWRIYLVTGGDGVLSYNGTHYQLKVGWMYIIPDFTKKTCQTVQRHIFYIFFGKAEIN